MIRAVLLDLDNTLLENDMERFVPAYLKALGEHMSGVFPPEMLIRNLLLATDAMTSDHDPEHTNMEVFDAAFFPSLGHTRQKLEPLFDAFYATCFPQLRALTRPNPAARPLVEWVLAHGLQVAIATNPLFPRTAIEQRLEWAGVPADEFPYQLVTSYEHMHSAKPHPAYFQEIARRLGRLVPECLMVGDDWRMDISPALDVGMQTYWIAGPDQTRPEGQPPPSGKGDLSGLVHWLEGRIAT